MKQQDETAIWMEYELQEGEQLVVNGALLAPAAPCRIKIGSGASVLHGRTLWARPDGNATACELYYSTLQSTRTEGGLGDHRYRLFEMLGRVVAKQRIRAAQEDCAAYAAALLVDDREALLRHARNLARRENSPAFRRIGSQAA